METILVMDEKNYDVSLPEIRRTAVRGIITENGKLLLIQSKFGEVKFPGGGKEPGETDLDTLAREVLEETGRRILPDSVRAFGQVEEIRRSTHEPAIWHQISRYYFCGISGDQENCRYTKNEIDYGFHFVWYTLDEAIRIYDEMDFSKKCAWNQREYNVLRLLKSGERKSI